MKKKMIVGISTVVILIVALIGIIKYQENVARDNARKVEFTDPEMGEIICLRGMRDDEIFTYYSQNGMDTSWMYTDYLKKIESLNIGYTGYYETLMDIEKCSNLKDLVIGAPRFSGGPYYLYDGSREIPEKENTERIRQIEKELTEILEKCPLISLLCIRNAEDTCELSNVEFLSVAHNIERLCLQEQGEIDYSPILECSKLVVLDLSKCNISELGQISRLENLKSLNLTGTNIAEAGDIVNMKQLETLRIKNTPLAENEEELQKIYDAFPDIKIEK